MGLPMAKKISFTFFAVFADVSMNRSPLSSAYACASCEHSAGTAGVRQRQMHDTMSTPVGGRARRV
jgi:hypothetical protein